MEAFALDRAVLDRDEAAAAESPLKPSPLADQDKAAAGAQALCDRARVEATTGLSHEVEEAVWVGEAAGASPLERDSTLGIQSNPGHRRLDRVSRGIEPAHPRRGKLTCEEERAVAIAAADLQDALRAPRQMEDSRGEGG